jgi:hypothetical protein
MQGRRLYSAGEVMSDESLTLDEHAEKMATIIKKGGKIFCHKDDEHFFAGRGIPYVVDQNGFIEKGKLIAWADI